MKNWMRNVALAFAIQWMIAAAPVTAQDLNATYEAAKQAALSGKTAESIKLFEQCIKVADQKKDLQKQIMIRITLATQYDSAGKFAAAEPLFAQAIKLATGTIAEQGVARIYQMQVRHYLLGNNFGPAAVALEKCIALGGKRDKDKDYGDFLALAANVYEGKGDLPKGLEYYKKSEAWLLTTPADKERARSLSSCLTNMSICYSAMGKLDEAESQLKRALQIGEEAFGKSFQGLYATHNALGNLYSKKQQYKLSVEEYDKALAILANTGVTDGALVQRIKSNRAISASKL